MTITDAAARLRDRFGVEPLVGGGAVDVTVPAQRWSELGLAARGELGCVYFNWMSAVDWKEQGFEVVCRVDNLAAPFGLTMRTKLGPDVSRCPSLTSIWKGADWHERECYDMFGIVFDGHPDLRRILLAQDWDGFPLRKDYAVDTPHPPYR